MGLCKQKISQQNSLAAHGACDAMLLCSVAKISVSYVAYCDADTTSADNAKDWINNETDSAKTGIKSAISQAFDNILRDIHTRPKLTPISYQHTKSPTSSD